MSLETVFVSAMAYTIMVSDDHRRVAVLSPLATVTVPAPVGFPLKFCTKIANMNRQRAIFVSGLSGDLVMLWPQTEVPLSIKDSKWTDKEACGEGEGRP